MGDTSTLVRLPHGKPYRYRANRANGRSAAVACPDTAPFSPRVGSRLNDFFHAGFVRRAFAFMTSILKAGRYEIVAELGRGAMGVVYKATDPVIGRPVAVKTIKLSEQGTGLTRSELIARFQTEARAAE